MAEQRPIPVGVYDLLTDYVGRKMSVRVFRLQPNREQVDRHRHRRSTQVYVALDGTVAIQRDGVETTLSPYEAVEVPPGVIHGARAVGAPAVLMNISVPPLAVDDQAPLYKEPYREDFNLPLDGGDIDD